MSDPESALAAIGVVLSSQHCRFLSVPWNDAFLKSESASSYLHRAYVDAYGDCANQWEIISSHTKYAQPSVTCAIERTLLETIHAAYSGRDLAFIRPYFSVAFNRFRTQMKSAKSVFAVVEEGALTVGRVLKGRVVDVEVMGGNGAWQDALSAWLARSALLEDELGKIFILCPPVWQGGATTDSRQEWNFLLWPEELMRFVTEDPALALPACTL